MDNLRLPKDNSNIKVDKEGKVYCWLCKTKVYLDDFSKSFGVCLKCKDRKRDNW